MKYSVYMQDLIDLKKKSKIEFQLALRTISTQILLSLANLILVTLLFSCADALPGPCFVGKVHVL